MLSQLASFFLGVAVFINPERAAAQRPIGIDVSDFQSSGINWSTLKNTYSIMFGWAKASEATSTNAGGTHFGTYAVNAHAAGVILGGYHFARYDLDQGTNGAVTEANAFWNAIKGYVKTDGLTLMPMLDMEETNTTGYTQTTMSQWADTWCTTVSNNAYAAGFVLKPCVYCSVSYASTWFNSTMTKWNLDIAEWHFSYASSQIVTPSHSPWPSWQFWQYDDTNNASVYTSGDGDVFNGTLAQLQSTMVVTPAGTPAITSQPVGETIWQGSNVTFSVMSTNATHYQWTFNQTNIAGATDSNYTIVNASFTNGGAYSVTLSNSRGLTVSDTAFLAVLPPLSNAPGAIVAPGGMVDWWPGDGNPNDIFGTIQSKPQGNFYYAPGKSGEAFHFDGLTAYISNNTTTTIPAPWTACMWVNYQFSPQSSAGLLEDGTYSLKLEQYNNTHKVGISQLSYADSVFNYTVPTNTWTHLAFVTTSTSVTLYANGISQGSITTNNFPCPRAFIGAGYVTSSAKVVDYLLGSVDDIMLFNRALSSTEINSIVNAGSAGFIRAPIVTSATVDTNGQFNLGLKGLTGKNYTVRSSTDLINWVTAGVVANPNGTNLFTVAGATNTPFKFYRVYQPY